MEYFVIFLFSILFSFYADKTYKNKVLFLFFSMLAITPLILMAGYRDENIGVDTLAYPQQTLDFIESIDNISQLNLLGLIVEPLYVLLGKISFLIGGNNLMVLLLFQHIIIVSNFYIAFVKFRNNVPIWIGMTMFCFLFYNMSLNLQRQMIAISFIFLATIYLLNGKKNKSIILYIIAFLFHKTSIIALLIYVSLYKRNVKWCKYSIAFSFLLLIAYSEIMSLIVKLPYFSKYMTYQQGNTYDSFFSITEFVTRLFFLWILFRYSILTRKSILSQCVFLLFICEFIINLTQLYSQFVGRFGYGLFVLYALFLPYFAFCYKNNTGRIRIRKVITSISITFIIFSWWYVYIISNAGETYPYSSRLISGLF